MLLHELLNSRRAEVLAACSAERTHPEGLDHLARYISEFFDDIVTLLKPGSEGLESLLRPGRAPADLPVLGGSPEMVRVRIGVDQLSHRSRAAVLILGEVGTGRRHCARALHAATYPEGEFFELVEGGLAELEQRVAKLRRDAASAQGLTVYVPDIVDVAASAQRYLAELIQAPLFQCRLVASSSEPLEKGSRQGNRLPGLATAFLCKLTLPPLRARTTDIAALAAHFAQELARGAGAPPITFSDSALEAMRAYSWPGNVAELADVVGRLWREFGSGLVEQADLPDLGDRTSTVVFRLPPSGIVFADLERAMLTQALAMADNNQTRAASLLGLTRDQLRYRMAKFALPNTGTRG